MLIFVSIVHVLLCVFMIFVILLQPGKDAGMGAALGGGAATSAFGGRGAVTFLGKLTAFCAVGFFVTALGLSFVGMRSSVAAEGIPVKPKPAAATPLPAATPGTEPAAATPAATTPAEVAPSSGGPSGVEKAGPAKGTEAVPAEKLPAEPAGTKNE